MNASILNLFPDLRKHWEEQERKDAELTDSMRTNCIDALADIADAMRHPRISLPYLEDAIAKLTVARDCAKALDQ